MRISNTSSILSAAVALLVASTATAQISYNENFDVDAAGWTVLDGFENGHYLDATSCGLAGGNLRSNMYGGAPSCRFESGLIGTALGGPLILSVDYKANQWSANTAPQNPWGSFDLEISSDGATWTNVGTVASQTTQTTNCQSGSIAFTPPAGDLYVRFVGAHTDGDYYLNIDNVDIQPNLGCTGAPAPGDTLVSGEICNGAGTANLSLQNSTSGAGVSYQWYESTVSSTGPWNALGTGETESVAVTGTTYFYCDVTCATGPDTTASNVGMIDGSFTFQNPQSFDTSTTDNCWEIDAPATLDINYNGTDGALIFDFWGAFTVGDEATATSPIFTALGAASTLYFDLAGANYQTAGDTISIEESADGGATWTTVVTLSNAVGMLANTAGDTANLVAPTADQWQLREAPLSAGTDRIRFRGTSDYGNNILIDNVSVGILPAAQHNVYGAGCGAGPVALSSATPPIAGNAVVFDATGAPEIFPGGGASVGVLIIDFAWDYAGTDISPLLDAGCNVHINSLDILEVMFGPVGTASAGYVAPVGFDGTSLYHQAAFLIPPTPTNLLGFELSNGVRSFINSY